MTTTATRPAAPAVSASDRAPTSGGMTHRQIMTILIGLLLGMFLAALDQTIVSTAMPRIANDLRGLNLQAWATTAYLITATISTPLYGKLSDLYGRKPFYLTAISIFVLGSAACTFAQSMYMLAVFRAFQGLGAGGLMSLAFTILGDIVSPRDRAKYQGYFLAVFGVSSVLGPVVGGALAGADHILWFAGWRWVFLVNVPIGAVALAVVAKVLNVPHRGRAAHHRIDWWGGLSLIIGLVPLLIVAEQGQQWGWGTTKSLICYAIGGFGILAFVLIERIMGDNALIPPRLFRNGVFTLVILAGVVVGSAMFGGITMIPQYFQIVRGASPTQSGLLMLPIMVGLMGASMVSGVITSRTGRYKIFPIIGSVLIIGGAVLLSRVAADSPVWQTMLYMFVFGAGVGLCLQTLTLAAQNAAPPQDMGVSTAAATFFRQIGGTLGVAVFLSILFSTVGDKIGNAIRAAFSTAPFQAALRDPAVRGNPTDQPVLNMLFGHGDTSATLRDASFIQHIDARLAEPFKIGFSQSIDLVFLVSAGVGVLGLIITLFIKEIPLRTQSGVDAVREAASEAVAGATSTDPDQTTPDGAESAEARNWLDTATTVRAGETSTDPDITSVRGRVRRTDGTPIDAAVVVLIDHAGQQVDRGVTDANGDFTLTAPAEGVHVLIASSIGHQPQAITLRAASASVHLDLRLTGTARVRGIVRADDGGPVSGATVTLTNMRGEVVAGVRSGANGEYALTELLPGDYTLVVSATERQPVALAVTVPDSGDTVIDVETPGAARLSGRARRGPDGRGVPDARVTLVNEAGQVVAMTSTDEDGAYSFADLPGGEYMLIASGYPPVTSRHYVRPGQDSVHDVLLTHSDI